jgi:single-strand DNA-binding protein
MPNQFTAHAIGHLGKDAEIKFLPDSTPVVKFNLAVTTGYGEKKITSWYSCSCFGSRYQKLAQWLTKGKPVSIVGEQHIRPWTSDSGVKNVSVEIRVSDLVFLGSRDEADHPAPVAAPAAEPQDASIPF